MQKIDCSKDIEEIEHVWIRMSDGVRLSARIFLPKNRDESVPAIFEMTPYRKRDISRETDEELYRLYAKEGYACIRIDIRGTGESEGVLRDEYTRREQKDALEVIDWIATQDWCNGNIGMTGMSWSGFNALQTAAKNPENLKAILITDFTDDRYEDDVHYKGGALLTENMNWGSLMSMMAAYPPDPEIVGKTKWRSLWRERLEKLDPLPARWMKHQTRDAYWKNGSVCEDYSAIECPVYAVSGWLDGYTNAVPRLLENIDAPSKGLIGPWSHTDPNNPSPGPEIGFTQESLRWWDYWLKDIDNGIMDEPRYTVWMQDYQKPSPIHDREKGRWIQFNTWQNSAVKPITFHLNTDTLEKKPAKGDNLILSSLQTEGTQMGEWLSFGADGDRAVDQSQDDLNALTFDTQKLRHNFEILGAGSITLDVKSDKPQANLIARLSDVAPDGSVSLVSYGVLNLTHRDSHEHPKPLSNKHWYSVTIPFNEMAYRFKKGHKIRLSLSTASWPLIWPSPEQVTLEVKGGSGQLTLPKRAPRKDEEAGSSVFEKPVQAKSGPCKVLQSGEEKRTTTRNEVTGETIHSYEGDGYGGGVQSYLIKDADVTIKSWIKSERRIKDDDPNSAKMTFNEKASISRDGWQVDMELDTSLESTEESFIFKAHLKAEANDRQFFEKSWRRVIPRNHV